MCPVTTKLTGPQPITSWVSLIAGNFTTRPGTQKSLRSKKRFLVLGLDVLTRSTIWVLSNHLCPCHETMSLLFPSLLAPNTPCAEHTYPIHAVWVPLTASHTEVWGMGSFHWEPRGRFKITTWKWSSEMPVCAQTSVENWGVYSRAGRSLWTFSCDRDPESPPLA